MSILTRSLSRSRRPSRTPAPRKTRLELNALDDRRLPSVTSVMSAGTLAITGDAANDDVILTNGVASQLTYQNGILLPTVVPSVVVQARTSPVVNYAVVANVPKSQITGITFSGGPGNDTFNATLMMEKTVTSADGGPGDDTLFGSWGNDVFYGSPGNDRYFGFLGNDQLRRNGYHGYFGDNGIGADATTGLVTGKMSYGELTVPGAQLFARPNPLNAKKIQLYGPSGAGFELRSDSGWQVTDRPTIGRTEYKALSTTWVYLETGHGYDLPLPAAAFQAVQIGYSTGGGTTHAGPVLSNLSVSLGNALGTALGDVKAKTGMDFSVPTLSGGIALGANLDSLGLPVAQAVPYLYAALGPTGQVAVAGVSVGSSGAGSGWGVSIAVDPTDSGAMVKLTTPAIELGFGWSQDGEIPYVPTLTPDDRANPQIAGNLYLHASGELPDLPVTLTGDLVMDLDANNDGYWCGLSPTAIGQMARGQLGLGALAGAINDIKFGFNGEVDAGFELSKSLELSLPMGYGSVYWTPAQNGQPGEVAFRATSANPFAGTAFETFYAGMGFDFQGRFNTAGDFRLAAESTGVSVDLDIGGLSLGSVHQSCGVEFSKDGGVVSLGAHYHFDMTIGDMSFLGASVAIDANLTFSVNTTTGAVSVSGGGTVDAELCLFGGHIETTFGVSFDNHGVYVDMPGGDALDFDILW